MRRRIKSELPWLGLTAVSSLLVWGAFPPHGLGLGLLAGLVPLFVALDRAPSWRTAALRGGFFGFLANVLVCAWLPESARSFGGMSWLPSVLSLLAMSLVEQGAWAVVAGVRHVLHRRLGVKPLLWTPLALMALDSVWPKYFPSTFGNVFYNVPWLAQTADVAGVWGLTAVLVAVNEALAALIARAQRRAEWTAREARSHGIAAALVFVLAAGYGTWRLSQVRATMKAPLSKMRVAIVQPGLNAMAMVRAAADKTLTRGLLLEHTLKLTTRALESGPELVVWPETSFPDTFHNQYNTREAVAVSARLDDFARERRPRLLFGGRDMSPEGRWYNAMYYLRWDDATSSLRTDKYHKTRLMLFSELVPFAGYLASYDKLLRGMGAAFFERGSGPVVIEGPGARLGPMICLEGLYPDYVRAIARSGAEVLVNATNDAWFGETAEPALHLYLTAFRSIETRRPMIRATTAGHSTVIDIDGQTRRLTELSKQDVLLEEVPIYGALQSPYLVLGSLPLGLAALYAAARFFAALIAARRPRRV